MTEIVFVTHSTSLDNERRLASGHADTPLSPLGRRQAAALGDRYRDTCLAAVVCSDLQRSYCTAEIAFAHRNIPIIKDTSAARMRLWRVHQTLHRPCGTRASPQNHRAVSGR